MGRIKKEQKKWKIGYVDVYKDPNNPLLVTTGEKIWSKKQIALRHSLPNCYGIMKVRWRKVSKTQRIFLFITNSPVVEVNPN